MIRFLALSVFFFFVVADARSFASYLSGAFFSLGMNLGGGSVLISKQPPLQPTGHGRYNSLQIGMQTEGGYQRYFTPFFGVSYYGYFGYRYLYMNSAMKMASDLNNVNRYTLGFGANMLFNVYSKIKNADKAHPKMQAYGFFGGLLTMVNIWTESLLDQSHSYVNNNANFNATLGISLRTDHFKWSLGFYVPLTNQIRVIKIPSRSGGLETLDIIDNYKSTQIFMNFTRVF
ncbi:outer membrane beta-barrel protein [Helicobacter suis]|uniref:outer membrane beta-barrel protein n=2 Tax=Helicobacter suis TaxID=104628 RepID=UPI000CF14FDB|nr:outer membrane beta-barrel protein [Helicobacter suis]